MTMGLTNILGLEGKKKEIPTEFVDGGELSEISPPVMVDKHHKVKLVRITNMAGAEGVRKIFMSNPSLVLLIDVSHFGDSEELKRAVTRIKQAAPLVIGLDSSWIIASTKDVLIEEKGQLE